MSVQLTVIGKFAPDTFTSHEGLVAWTPTLAESGSIAPRDADTTPSVDEVDAGRMAWRVGATRLSPQFFTAAVGFADFLSLALSGYLASRFCRAYGVNCAGGEWVLTTLLTTFIAFFGLYEVETYTVRKLRNLRHRFAATFVAVVLGGGAGLMCCALMPVSTPALRMWPLFWMPIAATLTGGLALACALLVQWLIASGHLRSRVAVVGINEYSELLISRLKADPDQTHAFVGLYDDGASDDEDSCGSRLHGRLSDLLDRLKRKRIDAVVLSLPLSKLDRITRTRSILQNLNCDIYIGAEAFNLNCETRNLCQIGGCSVIKVGSKPLDDWQLLQKSLFDLILAALMLIVLLPVIFLIGLAIRLDSPGPSLFRQPRHGFNNSLFAIYKFRTMYSNMTDIKADRQTVPNDPRVTRLGRVLRKCSLDELPQLINVIKGDMSLVGPRPHAPNTKAGDELFHNVVSDYALRHRVKPGITGWAQVNGWRGETRTREQIEQRVAHDFYYIDNWSLLLDVKILLLTLAREFNSKVAF